MSSVAVIELHPLLFPPSRYLFRCWPFGTYRSGISYRQERGFSFWCWNRPSQMNWNRPKPVKLEIQVYTIFNWRDYVVRDALSARPEAFTRSGMQGVSDYFIAFRC